MGNRHQRRRDAKLKRRSGSGKRECGKCTACCTTFRIVELDKPDYQKCPYETPRGCRRYGTRPPTCRAYSCLWLMGMMESNDRPDKIGIIFGQASEDPALLEACGGRNDAIAHEVWEGAAEGTGTDAIMRLTQGGGTAVRYYGGKVKVMR